MSKQLQQLTSIDPQRVVGLVPIRVSDTEIIARSVIIESARGNKGLLFIADSESKASTINSHTIFNEGEWRTISGDNFADLDGIINLRNIWIHGDKPGDRFVISYMDITGEVC